MCYEKGVYTGAQIDIPGVTVEAEEDEVDLNDDVLNDITAKLGLLTTESLNEEEDEDRETEGLTSLRIEHESIGFRRDE